MMITGAENIEMVRVLAVRGALRLETRGLRRRGRSARVLANEITGRSDRTAVAAYAALNAHIVAAGGRDWPL
jgi:hypothetical protein